MLAVVPPMVRPDAELIALRECLQRLLNSPTGEARKHVPVRLSLIGLLADRLRDVRTVEAMSTRLNALKDASRYADPELAVSYARGLDGLAARLRGNDRDAITGLEAVPFDRFPDYRAGALGSQTYERVVLAGLLHKAGRTAEALAWLRAIGEGLETSWYPAAHREMARIADATGDTKTARTDTGYSPMPGVTATLREERRWMRRDGGLKRSNKMGRSRVVRCHPDPLREQKLLPALTPVVFLRRDDLEDSAVHKRFNCTRTARSTAPTSVAESAPIRRTRRSLLAVVSWSAIALRVSPSS